MSDERFFCTAPRNAGDLLVREIAENGGSDIHEQPNGVRFIGPLEVGYRICLFSRIAGRVLLEIAGFTAASEDELYEASRDIQWNEHLGADSTFAINSTVTGAAAIGRKGAVLRVKDAVADYFSDAVGRRPSVDTEYPDCRIAVHVSGDNITVYFNISGESLHRRGYRKSGGPAPLKENVAAAMLLRSSWDTIAADGGALVDPMCGVGTIPIEGALIAGDIAPGLLRTKFGFERWKRHDAALWREIMDEASERRRAGAEHIPVIVGYDANRRSITEAVKTAGSVGLGNHIHFEKRDVSSVIPPKKGKAEGKYLGLIATNPPYGVRMGSKQDLVPLYRGMGRVLKTAFPGWKTAIITADKELSMATGLKAQKVNTLYNGSIECILAQSDIFAVEGAGQPSSGKREIYEEQFGNRLKKNFKEMRTWAEREGISCFRVYDADMPEFAAAIDLYEHTWVHIQEYSPPETVNKRQADLRLQVILDVTPRVLEISRSNVFVKTRARQSSGRQYEAMGSSGVFHEIHEGGLSFLCNFTDYLDTGIFLDHRITRDMIRSMSKGKTFLNLFSYTASATVYAADGGSTHTTSIDNSNTYTEWARENLNINGIFGNEHELVRDEARRWLTRGVSRFDLIFLDPPTFSRSKSFQTTFQVQRDHIELIQMALKRLTKDGILLFSTNFQKFKLQEDALEGLHVTNLTRETVPHDYRRSPRIHQLWRISP